MRRQRARLRSTLKPTSFACKTTRRGVDPFRCKVEELHAQLARHASVSVVWDASFRTNKSAAEGAADCKNALIIGHRHRHALMPLKMEGEH